MDGPVINSCINFLTVVAYVCIMFYYESWKICQHISFLEQWWKQKKSSEYPLRIVKKATKLLLEGGQLYFGRCLNNKIIEEKWFAEILSTGKSKSIRAILQMKQKFYQRKMNRKAYHFQCIAAFFCRTGLHPTSRVHELISSSRVWYIF